MKYEVTYPLQREKGGETIPRGRVIELGADEAAALASGIRLVPGQDDDGDQGQDSAQDSGQDSGQNAPAENQPAENQPADDAGIESTQETPDDGDEPPAEAQEAPAEEKARAKGKGGR